MTSIILNVRKALGVATFILVLGAAACTDPTVAPKSTIPGATFFSDPNSYKEFLAKVYAGLAIGGQLGGDGSTDIQGIDGGFSQYMRLYWELQELPTDEAVIGWGDLGLQPLNTQTWDPGNPFVRAMYYRVFFQVSMANEFLRQTAPESLTARGVGPTLAAQIQTYRAEARFLRALSYWHGIDFFADIPLVTENDQVGASAPLQSTRATIYAYLVAELNAIKADLPPAGDPKSYGRATGPAADMLLAELYLNDTVYTGTANWSAALTAAANVINSGVFGLASNYRYLFEADNDKNSNEIIFAIPEDGTRTQTFGSTNFLVHAQCGGSMDNNAYGIDGCWWGLRLKPQADSLFAAGDTRSGYFYTSGQTLGIADLSNFTQGYAAPKFTNIKSTGGPGSSSAFVDIDFPMFRLGEAYLIYAEAHVRGGGGTDSLALAYVNALRERAYGNTSGDITLPGLTLPFILAERGRELLWEGHRRTDLIRYGLFTGGSYLWAWKGNTLNGTTTPVHLSRFPIPATELIANPNLKQNPGY